MPVLPRASVPGYTSGPSRARGSGVRCVVGTALSDTTLVHTLYSWYSDGTIVHLLVLRTQKSKHSTGSVPSIHVVSHLG